MNNLAFKQKTCCVCKEKFSPRFSTTQKVCRVKCAVEYSKAKGKKEADKAHRKNKTAFNMKDIKKRKPAAQAAFNAFIRARDESQPCISCQRHHTKQYHAGHYKTTAARPDLRFNEDNCHKQCSACNNHLSGNIEKYRPNLITKIGRERFDALERERSANHTAESYRAIEIEYKAKLKELVKL